MEGKLITTTGLKAYTQQLKTWIGGTYQTKADMTSYTKTADLFTYLDTRYIAKDSSLYGNPIYKHTVTVVSNAPSFMIYLTIFTTRATKYKNEHEFSTDWVAKRNIISVLAYGKHYSGTVFEGTVVGVISGSDITVRISGIQASSTVSNWDQVCTLNTWSYVNQQSNPGRI